MVRLEVNTSMLKPRATDPIIFQKKRLGDVILIDYNRFLFLLIHSYEPETLQKRIDYATEEQINELRKDTATMAFLSHNGHKIKVNA